MIVLAILRMLIEKTSFRVMLIAGVVALSGYLVSVRILPLFTETQALMAFLLLLVLAALYIVVQIVRFLNNLLWQIHTVLGSIITREKEHQEELEEHVLDNQPRPV